MRRPTQSGAPSGRAARLRSPPWAASANYYVQDGVVPRTRLPEVLGRIGRLEEQYGLRVGNVFHVGDGNLHPLVLYDRRNPGEPERAKELAESILEICMDVGGALTGEHGIGTDKACRMPLLFSRPTSTRDARAAGLRPGRALNPGKIFPTPRLCGECPVPTACTRWSWPDLASASDDVSVGAGPVRPAPPPKAPGIVEPATIDEAARVFAEAAAEGWTVSIDRSGGGVVSRPSGWIVFSSSRRAI